MKKIYKQPNGRYCYCSYKGVEKIDLSEQDILAIFLAEAEEAAKDAIKNAKNFGEIIKDSLTYNNPLSDEVLKQIGFTESYKELVKYVPRKPLDPRYVSCDFATYAKCPNCNQTVQDGIGFKQEKCCCGQMLKWE